MEMIIGGAFQGKSVYAKEHYPEIHWEQGGELDAETILAAQGVLDFQDFVRRELKEGREVTELARGLTEHNPNLILTCQEVGYGVVPIDAFDRKYREAVGRVCTELAAFSGRVTRIVCGIGTVIKEEGAAPDQLFREEEAVNRRIKEQTNRPGGEK